MKAFYNPNGTLPRLKFYAQKEYGMNLEEVTAPEMSVNFMSRFIDSELMSSLANRVYSIDESTASKGTSMLPDTIYIVSMYHSTYAIKHSGGSTTERIDIVDENDVVILTIYDSDTIIKL